MFTTRFAPSPTGPLHLGHAYSALLADAMDRAEGGVFLLRIEDVDQSRARAEWEAQIFDDLSWLGLDWQTPVMRQSRRLPVYERTLMTLAQRGLLYPCSCNRRDVQAALSAPQEGAAPSIGPDGPVYPGTCRGRPMASYGENDALRLDIARACDLAEATGALKFRETGAADAGIRSGLHTLSRATLIEEVGDVVLARRGVGTSYHLSVVLDDAAQGVSHVVRGADLFAATAIHVLLQRLLGLPTPVYHHHRLIRDAEGKRLAKRDDARALRTLRAEGATRQDIRAMVGL